MAKQNAVATEDYIKTGTVVAASKKYNFLETEEGNLLMFPRRGKSGPYRHIKVGSEVRYFEGFNPKGDHVTTYVRIDKPNLDCEILTHGILFEKKAGLSL